MHRRQEFGRLQFPADILSDARNVFEEVVAGSSTAAVITTWVRTVTRGATQWAFDSDEEFLAEYRMGVVESAQWLLQHGGYHYEILVGSGGTIVNIGAPTRPEIERVFDAFHRAVEQGRVETIPFTPLRVFIGHGGNEQWKELKDHLHEQHGYGVEAYEIGARAGHAVRDILEQMMDRSAFALLVMTAEDETAGGEMRARQNVVHETGLFQGRLGFARAVAVVEEGVEVFSNLAGIQQIRFPAGHIRETFGDVLATLRREFLEIGVD